MEIDFPFYIDRGGRTATTDEGDHLRDLIEQVLFTTPGERVNRPDFGSGLLQLVFAPNSDELAATLQFTVQASLQQWLGDRLEVVAADGRIAHGGVVDRHRRLGRLRQADREREDGHELVAFQVE